MLATTKAGQIGETLKARRVRAGMSVVAVASELWCTPRYVYMVERGDRVPNHRTLDCFVRAIGIDDATATRLHASVDSLR